MDQNTHIEKQKKLIAIGVGVLALLIFPKLTVFAAFCAGLFFLVRQTKSPWVIMFLLLTPIVTLVFYNSIVMGSRVTESERAYNNHHWLLTWIFTAFWGTALAGVVLGVIYLIYPILRGKPRPSGRGCRAQTPQASHAPLD